MNWADADGVSYLAWGWWVLGNTSTRVQRARRPRRQLRPDLRLRGPPVAPDGTNLHSHLAALSAAAALAGHHRVAARPAGARPYSATLAASGGNPPYTWSVSSGALPAGLHLSTAGVISGTPTAKTTSDFTVKVVDTHTTTHTQQTATKALSIKIAQAPPAMTKVSPASRSGAGGTKVTITGTLLNGADGGEVRLRAPPRASL